MNNENLKPWPSGVSGNPIGRKKGSKNLSTIVSDYLEKDVDISLLRGESELIVDGNMTNARAIVLVMIAKAINGDIRAVNWIANQSNSFKAENDGGFFSRSKLQIEIVESKNTELCHDA